MKRIVAVIVFALVVAWLVARGEIGSEYEFREPTCAEAAVLCATPARQGNRI